MIDTNIKTHVKGSATFAYYRENALWYRTESGLLFPIPVEDMGATTVLATEKAIFFMRWIRKYLASLVQDGVDA